MNLQQRLMALALGLVFIAGLFVGLWIRRPKAGPEGEPGPAPRDTCWLHDTLTVQLPAPKAERIRDTCWLPAVPQDPERDTIYVPVPITSRYYSEPGWEAWVSGYNPSLDSLRIDQATAVVEVPVFKTVTKHARWGIGVQAGATYLPGQNQVQQGRVQPYVGLGISYNIITF